MTGQKHRSLIIRCTAQTRLPPWQYFFKRRSGYVDWNIRENLSLLCIKLIFEFSGHRWILYFCCTVLSISSIKYTCTEMFKEFILSLSSVLLLFTIGTLLLFLFHLQFHISFIFSLLFFKSILSSFPFCFSFMCILC